MYALLLARDPEEIAILSLALKRAGLAVNVANDPAGAVRTWPERPADLIVLAIDGDLVTHINRFRGITSMPIVTVVEPISEALHCKILEAGADWIVVRPFSTKLLIAQLQALMRRAGGVQLFSLPTLNLSGLTLDPATRTVQIVDRPPRRLTHLEFRLLYTLMIHRNQILSSEGIVERVWGYTGKGDKELVRGLVRRLRAKVEPNPSNPRYILTVPGTGYSFASEDN
jgi:DNA-binding response OmpR family regulator